MATQKILVLDSTTNRPKQLTPNTTSAGAADAGKIPALNGAGQIDSTMLPGSNAMPSMSIPTSESLAAGAMVNLYSASGTLTARNANASDATKPAHGFVLAATTSPANAAVYFNGSLNNGASGLTIGSPVFLSAATAGAVTTTAPTAPGNLIQRVGQVAESTSEFVYCDDGGLIA